MMRIFLTLLILLVGISTVTADYYPQLEHPALVVKSTCNIIARSYDADDIEIDPESLIIIESASDNIVQRIGADCFEIFVEIFDSHYAQIKINANSGIIWHQSPFTSGGWEGQKPLKPVNTIILLPDGIVLHQHISVENYPKDTIKLISPDDGSIRELTREEKWITFGIFKNGEF